MRPSNRLLSAVAAERVALERQRIRLANEARDLRAALARIEAGMAEIDERRTLLDRLAPAEEPAQAARDGGDGPRGRGGEVGAAGGELDGGMGEVGADHGPRGRGREVAVGGGEPTGGEPDGDVSEVVGGGEPARGGVVGGTPARVEREGAGGVESARLKGGDAEAVAPRELGARGHAVVLRGPAIREAAVRVLVARGEDSLHYREWFARLTADGYEVAGKDPLAVFLTQISRSPAVRKGPKAGVYELDRNAAARARRTLANLHDELAALTKTRDLQAIRARRAQLTAEIEKTEKALEEIARVLAGQQAPPRNLAAATR